VKYSTVITRLLAITTFTITNTMHYKTNYKHVFYL